MRLLKLRARVTALGLSTSVLVSACGSSASNPAAPSPNPHPTMTTITVVDGLTNATVGASGTVTYKNGTTTIANGSAQLQDIAVGDRITISGVSGYRDRNTLYCGNSSFTLWLNKPGDVDDPLTRALGYAVAGGAMYRPDAVYLLPSADIQADARAMRALRDAASRVMATIEGKTPISVTTSTSNPGTTYTVSINPNSPSTGLTQIVPTANGGLADSWVQFQAIWAAEDLPIVMHEVTRTLGINGNNPYPGLMNAGADRPDFTDAERHVLLLRYTRPLLAVFPGDNDQMVGCR